MKTTKWTGILLLGLLLCMALLWPQSPAVADGSVSALYINVGKADAALYFLGNQRFLVDTGTKDSYDQLERVLKAYDITRLDGVLITHTDKDHVGGLKKLLKSDIWVERLYAGTLHSEASVDVHPVYEAAQKYHVPLTWLSAGDSFSVGNGVFQVLGPLTQDAENENNNSLVLQLKTPDGSFLLTGDMELEEEASLTSEGLIARADVLKVPHHGEDDATSRTLALLVKPQWAVISTSTAEEPDTPDHKVLSRLWEAKAGVAITQEAEVGILITLSEGTATAESINWK